MIERRFHPTYTLRGVRKPLIRTGCSCQSPPVFGRAVPPARRAMERDDEAVASRVKVGVPPLAGECGPARKPGGGPWSLADLRRRNRLLHDAAALAHPGTTRPHPRWCGAGAALTDGSRSRP
ncbi:hypothetical protein GCM10010405_51210 [Streptomyces macrosporus]|uniref:Uncharacterized protein n=1 Tax=Streptomyces macrosporus TaxID=44032 RepID=A0ABN3KI34_9ACTN